MSLYTDLKEFGVETANYHSCLQFEDTANARTILAKYPMLERQSVRFQNQITGEPWIEVPFAFDPYWEAKKCT